MIYQERTLTFRQLSEGFSSDGAPVSGIVKAERLGDTLAVRPVPFHLAPLTDGRYACVLTDGRATEVFDVARETRRRSPLDLGGPLCALLCFVGAVVSPVAIAQSGDLRCKPEDLAQILALPHAENAGTGREAGARPQASGAHAAERPSRPAPPEQEQPPASEAPAAEEAGYDDEALAETDYYFDRIETDDSYYRSVKDEVEESFASLPPFDGFRDSLPNAQFVRSGEYLLGKLCQAGKVRYLLFAAKTKEALPAELRERAYFVPCSLYDRAEGYYVLFQDAGTGETVAVRRV